MWFMGFNGIAWDRKWDLDSKVGLVHYKQLVYLHVYGHVEVVFLGINQGSPKRHQRASSSDFFTKLQR